MREEEKEEVDDPPAMSTCPSGSNVAEWSDRAVVMLLAEANVPEDCATALVAVPTMPTISTKSGRAPRDIVKGFDENLSPTDAFRV